MANNNNNNNNTLNSSVTNISNLDYTHFSNTSEKIAQIRKKYLIRGANGKINPLSFSSQISNPAKMDRLLSILDYIKFVAQSSKNTPSRLKQQIESITMEMPYLRLLSEDGKDLYLSDPALYTNPDLIEKLIDQVSEDMDTFPQLQQKEKEEYQTFIKQIESRLPSPEPNTNTPTPPKKFTLGLPPGLSGLSGLSGGKRKKTLRRRSKARNTRRKSKQVKKIPYHM